MALPISGTMSLSQIATEFNKTPPVAMSSLYGIISGIPVSGAMSISTFYGKSAVVAGNSPFSMTVGTIRSDADGKYITVGSNIYGFSTINAIGTITPASYRSQLIADIFYAAYDNGKKFLVVTIGTGFGTSDGTDLIPVTLAKRITFSSGQSFLLPTSPSDAYVNLLITWVDPVAGRHNASTVIEGAAGTQKNLQFIIALGAAPFPLSGTVGVTLEYDV